MDRMKSRRGSVLLEGALWSLLIVLSVTWLGGRFIRFYRGFQRALGHQRSTLHY